jgi:hypothetical protein
VTAAAPSSRAAVWLSSARTARQAGAAIEVVRSVIDLACESEPDAPAPWAALAELELSHGDTLAAARAYLAVSIRTEGSAAAEAALVATRLFLEQGHPPEALRAMRAASLGDPANVAPELVQAIEALGSGWPEAAAGLLARLDPAGLGDAVRAVHDQVRRMVDWSAGVSEVAALNELAGPSTEPALHEPAPGEAALDFDLGSSSDLAFDEIFMPPEAAPTPPPDSMVAPPREPAAPSAPVAAGEPAVPEWSWESDGYRGETPQEPAAVLVPPEEVLELALAAARQDPSNADALLEVAELADALAASASPYDHDRLAELARLALSIGAFVAPDRARAPEAPPLAAALSEAARDRVALPETIGPLGKLLSLLTPHLEPLFPADLQRRGITAANRLVAPRAPLIREPLETAAALLSARAHAVFLVELPGALITLENTRPPALIVPSGLAALPLGARRFLATRALDQLERGGALVGKFAPRDVGILLELACRFAGGQPPPLGLPAARAGAFLSAMARGVPPVLAARVASLGPSAADELAGVELGPLAEALQRTSARVALLATGDPAGAFTALLAAELPGERISGADALQLPSLRELATLALSEAFLDLRVAVVG